MIQLTQRDLQQAYDQVSSAHRIISGHKAKTESIAQVLTTGLPMLVGAGGSAILAGRFGAPFLSVFGHELPLDMAAGLGIHALGFFGAFGKYAEPCHNFAWGVMSQYVTRAGVAYGAHLREKAGLPRVAGLAVGARHGNMPGARTGYDHRLHGNMPGTGAEGAMATRKAPLTAAELAAMAARAR